MVVLPSAARRGYVSSSFCQIARKNNAFPRAKLARYVRYAVLVMSYLFYTLYHSVYMHLTADAVMLSVPFQK